MLRLPVFVILAAFLLAPDTGFSREAGWVPIPSEPYKPRLGAPSSAPKKAVIRSTRKNASSKGDTVYDQQPPVTEAELAEFILLLPQFRGWAKQNHEEAHPIVNSAGKPDFLYSAKTAEWVASHGFAPARFFCVMGRMAAGVVIIEEGNDLQSARPRDMPHVDQQEVALARRHLGELLTAASGN